LALLWPVAARAAEEGLEAILLSPASTAGSGGVPIAVEAGEAEVAAFVRAVKALPQNPVGRPVWRFDVVRGGSLADSFALSERESELLGPEVKPLLQRARGTPSAYLYRVELAPAALARLGSIVDQLRAAGFQVFYPVEERSLWSAYEIMVSAYEQKEVSQDKAVAGAAPASAAASQIEARLRSLIPRPVSASEERIFQRLIADLQRQYREITEDPGIRSLQVDYSRQRWRSEASGGRNLSITARYSVRTPAELQALERYYARAGGPKGRAILPEQIALQLIGSEPDAARVKARLSELVPGLRSVRPGR
jgi:hypothetical protein